MINAPRAAEMTSAINGSRLSWMQVATIWHVAWAPGIRQLDLSRRVGLAPSTMSKICSRLVAVGLLRAEGSEEDHRARHIHLTQDGVELATAIYGIGDDIVSRVSPSFTEAEIDTARRVIEQMIPAIPSDTASSP